MTAGGGLEQLVDSLLWEGYALYPYTPGATKNATPTPFGIVYPPAYADGRSTFDQLVMECVADAGPGAELRAELRFLQPSGERHEAVARTAELPPARDRRRAGHEDLRLRLARAAHVAHPARRSGRAGARVAARREPHPGRRRGSTAPERCGTR